MSERASFLLVLLLIIFQSAHGFTANSLAKPLSGSSTRCFQTSLDMHASCQVLTPQMVWSPLADKWRNAAKSHFLSGGSLLKQPRSSTVILKDKKSQLIGNVYGATLVALIALVFRSTPALAEVSALAEGSIDVAGNGFLQAFSLVFVSEIGDKTFFIAGLLAAKTSRFISFTGSIAALSVMTVISVLIGVAFHSVPSVLTKGIPFDDIIAVAAFLYFGIITLREASKIPDDDNSGMEAEAAEAEESVGKLGGSNKDTFALIAQTFGLVFAAEFGDRSFLTTIALSAAQSPLSVAGGAIMAHASATGIAVMGGALLSKFISEKLVGYIGGTLFIIFAFTTALGLF